MNAFFASLLGSRFWIPAYLSFFLGFVIPGEWDEAKFLIPIFLGGILYFSCLTLSLAELVDHLAERTTWQRIGVLTAIKLLTLPLGAWLITRLIAPDWALGVLLVCAMPAGLSSIAFTGILAGNRVLALVFVLVSSALVPLTAPALLSVFTPETQLAIGAIAWRALYMLALLVIPFALAQATRRWLSTLVNRHHARWSGAAVICSCLMGMAGVLVNRELWAAWDWHHLLMPFALVCGLAGGIVGVGVAARRWLAPGDATAFACGIAYMNNGLALAFAVQFFSDDPHMILPAVLIQVPMIGAVAMLGWLPRQRLNSAP